MWTEINFDTTSLLFSLPLITVTSSAFHCHSGCVAPPSLFLFVCVWAYLSDTHVPEFRRGASQCVKACVNVRSPQCRSASYGRTHPGPCSRRQMMIVRAVRSDGPSSLSEHNEHTYWRHSSLPGFHRLLHTRIASIHDLIGHIESTETNSSGCVCHLLP